MIYSIDFWETEGSSPLLRLDRGYMRDGKRALERSRKWMTLVLGPDVDPVCANSVGSVPMRMLVADAERTFCGHANRESFVSLLARLCESFGDYSQGMCYVAGFLRLLFDDTVVERMMSRMNRDERYVPGYWMHEAVAYATDAYVFQELLREAMPDIAKHLVGNGIDASAYCQKWFVGLCVHVLPFEHLFTYFEGFLIGGYAFCMRFGLALLKQLGQRLLGSSDVSRLFALLRLDPKHIPHDDAFDAMMERVFEDVGRMDLSAVDFRDARIRAYDLHLRERMHKEESHSDDGIEDCALCRDDLADISCEECKTKMCDACHVSPPTDSTHFRYHAVRRIGP